VRTHLENIYQRLNVTSRTAAFTRAFPDGVA
jgi:DNA-binding NarL/FixJ family response regulator